MAKASPNLKDKEVAIKLCRIWNQLGEEEQAPYFSAAAKYPQRERAEMGECLNEALAVLGVKNRGDIEGLDDVNMEAGDDEVKVEAEVAAKVAEHGSVEEIEKKRHEVQRQEEEHWHVEEENQLQLQVFLRKTTLFRPCQVLKIQ